MSKDKKVPQIYLIGSLRNKKIPHIAREIREKTGLRVFDDWFSPGPEADDFWRKYEKVKGSTYREALTNWAGKHVFEFDHHHVNKSEIGLLIMPAGKSGHLELGYMIGQGKPCFMLLEEESERWDVMVQFCFLNGGNVCENFDDLKKRLLKLKKKYKSGKKKVIKK